MMHGLILRTVQVFVQDTYGGPTWLAVAERAGLDFGGFEAMLLYENGLIDTLLDAAVDVLDKPKETLLEDLGTYLVSHPNSQRLRRLLRFGGVDYIEFLHSLDDLPDRARLAVGDLDLPSLELGEQTLAGFTLHVTGDLRGFGCVMVGMLRAMADDYGALVLLDHKGNSGNSEEIEISVVEADFTEGREFDLASDLPGRNSA